MKILLIVPPYRTTDALVSQLYPMPLGLVSIGTRLQMAGHTVTIKDFLLPATVSATKPPSSFKGTHNPPYRHYGMPLKDCTQWLDAHHSEYDAIGMNMGQCNVWETGAALGTYITHTLHRPLVIGGPFVTTSTAEAFALTDADVAVIGEGENVVNQAFKLAFGNHPCRVEVHGTPVEPWDIPLPDWKLAPPGNYPTYKGMVRGVLTTSRGCPHACKFCSVHTIMGRHYRCQPYQRILDELNNLAAHGVTYYCFLDDNLLLSEQHATDVFNAVQALNKPHICYMEEGMEVRTAALPGMLGYLINCQFDNIAIGLETLNDAQRMAMQKPYSHNQLEQALDNFKHLGLIPKAFYIIGFPGDTVASVCRDIVQFGKLGLAARPNNLKLYPGTEMTAKYLANGWITKYYDWRQSSYFTPTSTGLTYQQIRRLKTVLGAIGTMAERHKVAMLKDNFDDISDGFHSAKLELQIGGGCAKLVGKFYRPTPYAYALGLMLQRQGWRGFGTSEVSLTKVVVMGQNEPADEIQEALYCAIREADNG